MIRHEKEANQKTKKAHLFLTLSHHVEVERFIQKKYLWNNWNANFPHSTF